MTVPGKGGRPRKWRSNADRVRAFRARQAGRDGPPELAQALADGDELARAMEEIRALRAELVAAADTERALRQEVRSVRRELAASEKRFGWLEQASDATRVAKEVAERERDALAHRLRELETRDRVAESGTPPTGRAIGGAVTRRTSSARTRASAPPRLTANERSSDAQVARSAVATTRRTTRRTTHSPW